MWFNISIKQKQYLVKLFDFLSASLRVYSLEWANKHKYIAGFFLQQMDNIIIYTIYMSNAI